VSGAAPRRFEAVVLDLDGTLVDSVGDIADALNRALCEAGLAGFDESAVKRMVGGGGRRLVERALAATGAGFEPELVERVLQAFLAAYRAAPCVRTELYPKAREVLEAFSGQGIRLGICTNKPADVTEAILSGLGVRRLFGSVIGSAPGVPLKPAPDMVRQTLAELEVPATAAVMVGDGAADLGAAHALGVPVVLLAHGYSATPVSELGADAVAHGFGDLPGVLAALKVQAGRY
jgi:phosphoglycolate phosphatase